MESTANSGKTTGQARLWSPFCAFVIEVATGQAPVAVMEGREEEHKARGVEVEGGPNRPDGDMSQTTSASAMFPGLGGSHERRVRSGCHRTDVFGCGRAYPANLESLLEATPCAAVILCR